MDEAHKELVKRLRAANYSDQPEWTPLEVPLDEAADALEAQAAEIERLTTEGVHTCHDQCQRLACVQGREIAELKQQLEEAEVARLRDERLEIVARALGAKT